jgi:hypothetical protein
VNNYDIKHVVSSPLGGSVDEIDGFRNWNGGGSGAIRKTEEFASVLNGFRKRKEPHFVFASLSRLCYSIQRIALERSLLHMRLYYFEE